MGPCLAIAVLIAITAAACSSLPATHYEKFTFPHDAYIGDLKDRPHTVLGQVRAREDYQTLDPTHDEDALCKNYFNKGARELLKYARAKNADAVIDVKSVTFNADGTTQTYDTPQCADDGQNGQILMEGVAVKWGGAPAKTVGLQEPSTEKFRALRLKKDEDGMDGGIYVAPLAVEIYTMDRKILSKLPIPLSASDTWFTGEFLRSPKARTVFMNIKSDSGDVVSRPLSIDSKNLDFLRADDSGSRKSDPLVLVAGKSARWRLTDSQPRDLLQVSSVDGSGQVIYIRYHLDLHGGWTKFTKTASGSWDASKPFPPIGDFPQLDYSPK